MQKSERVNFGSKIGAVLAAAGSAVGLGNIWRFPYETGNHGGAAFILVYLACVFMLGMPIMIAEFTVGRHSKASTGRAYKVLAPGTHWKWLGYLGDTSYKPTTFKRTRGMPLFSIKRARAAAGAEESSQDGLWNIYWKRE